MLFLTYNDELLQAVSSVVGGASTATTDTTVPAAVTMQLCCNSGSC